MGGNEDEIAETMRQSGQSGPSQQTPSTAKSGQKPPGKRPMAMTLRDLQGSGDGDEDDEDDEKPRDLFAG
ncbi:hypothetical protein LTR53_020351, partial [Teratosphaeriaceae sp. CCFEE 6253]